jgi:cytochrome c oxidase subunit 4
MEHVETAHHEGHSPEEIKKHIKIYIGVFGTLAFLTVVTVAVSYLHLPLIPATVLALTIASIKASLVIFFFMHLKSEKAWIYSVLFITVVNFISLIVIIYIAELTVLNV